MLKRLHVPLLLVFVAFAITSCSRKKNTFLSRNFHALTAEYNALYNGGLAIEDGREALATAYRDNYWGILPVERVKIEDRVPAPGEQPNENFSKAEEKAAKAIQKHSIYINAKEYNPQIDEAYMLLGRARYFDGRFVPALDAFNYILYRYPTSNNINYAKVWKAKANIRLQNEDVALEDLQKMLEEEKLGTKELADATAILAQAYINLDSLAQALPYIKLASAYEPKNALKGRYTFIKGQLYDRLNIKDSANMAYDEVIALNRKSPRVYMINAYIAKGKNFNYDKEDKIAFLELLRDLETDRENRPYLDKIYNQMGDYHLNIKNTDTAISYYNRSIKKYSNDRYLQSINYKTLAEINFDASRYKNAGLYYDSTLTFLEPITRDYRRIKKKRENLDDVIKYEDIAVRYDSILRLAHMSEGDRLAFFTEYTTGLREKAVRDSIANAQQKETLANNEFFKPGNTIGKTNEEKKKQGGRFYFYNPTSVGYGRQAFRSNWGDRKLEDYWRLSSIQKSKVSGATVSVFKEGNVSRLYDPAAYAAKIPTGPKVIDSLTKDRNFAYYQLGLIYKEKFKEYTLAVNRLEKLLTYKPEERLLLPAKYNLYKIYAQQGNETLAAQLKNDILTNHAGTRYAEIVANPILLLEHGEGSPEYNYTQLYREFEQARYANVINRADGYIAQYNGTEHVPKFEMLKATAMGRQQGIAAYKKALNYVALNYPSTYEGEEAQKIYSTVIPNLEALKFTPDADVVGEWKIVYTFPTAQREAAKTLRAKIEEALKQYRYETNKTSLDHYSLEILFVVIHGFKSQSGARGAAHLLRGNKGNTITRDYFEIATPNYKVVQLHKNLEGYLNRPTTVGTNQEPQK